MLSALKKLTKSNDDRCPAPMPMSSSLQKKFSKGVHFNMKILIKGDRNVGKSCLLQRLQGGPFIEEYVPTDQIQVAPIHWTYKNTDYIVKVEVWEVVDKGRTKKKPPLGLKLENQSVSTPSDDGYETPVLDATFLDVYKNASGVILMLDITKPWTFEYVVKELSRVPADLPVVVLGNHCDMQHHRQVHPHHIEQALSHAKMTRTAPIRYAESSMRNGFGLRLLHKFLSVPFLRLQKTSLLEQLQRNQKDMEEIEKELDDFQNSEESHYNLFVDRLANKRRQSTGQQETRPNNERSPSIVLGAGKPIVPPSVNPLLAQSLNPMGIKAQYSNENQQVKQSQFVNPELLKPKHSVSMDMTPSKMPQDSGQSTPTGANVSASSGGLDEFYAGTLDSSFLEDLTPLSTSNQEVTYDSDSDDGNTTNPMVTFDEDDLDVDVSPTVDSSLTMQHNELISRSNNEDSLRDQFMTHVSISKDSMKSESSDIGTLSILSSEHHSQLTLDNDFPLWAGDSSARRSPEGGEDPDNTKESDDKVKKHKKKKSKSKEKGDGDDATDHKEKKHKHRKSKSDKRSKNPQQDLLAPTTGTEFNYEEYDSI
ncbi:rab-like protein 6 isoform X2 [Pectinophora gossypiella]|uniref:GTP-binding protein Parf n=1 Tax=Pectinophora gossypiella TaxID=13191 RepID=A0A1E1WF33_PECGO|nr:rab-like protein 6 isoform X2 [Pectinophora gossypiella]